MATELEALTRDFLKSKIAAGVFSGASVLYGKPFRKIIEVHEGTIGFGADLAQPISPTTSFDLQSITKSVATSALFLKMWQQGKVQLKQAVGPFLNAKNSSALNQITFEQLLTHSSGLSDADLSGQFQTPNELWLKMLNAKPVFAPGESIEYTDLGYRLLGKALESISGLDLESACQNLLWKPMNLQTMTYLPKDRYQTAATPDAHGFIDDEQVHFLGDVLGCDGVFSNAEDLFLFMSNLLQGQGPFQQQTFDQIHYHVAMSSGPSHSFFETLAVGSKNLGWEINPEPFSYAGHFANPRCFEKAGGAGTFIWMDQQSQSLLVYLTNHGKPKPFDETTWNRLVQQVAPHELSNLIFNHKS